MLNAHKIFFKMLHSPNDKIEADKKVISMKIEAETLLFTPPHLINNVLNQLEENKFDISNHIEVYDSDDGQYYIFIQRLSDSNFNYAK